MKNIIVSNQAPAAIGPYSQAVEFGGVIYTSGMLPINPETGVMPESIEAQAAQSLTNLKNLLESCGSDMTQVIKTTVFIKNMEDFPKINQVYQTYFSENFPARSCVEVARLPKDALIEIELIALKK